MASALKMLYLTVSMFYSFLIVPDITKNLVTKYWLHGRLFMPLALTVQLCIYICDLNHAVFQNNSADFCFNHTPGNGSGRVGSEFWRVGSGKSNPVPTLTMKSLRYWGAHLTNKNLQNTSFSCCHITWKRGSAEPNVMDTFAFPVEHAIFRYPPIENHSIDWYEMLHTW